MHALKNPSTEDQAGGADFRGRAATGLRPDQEQAAAFVRTRVKVLGAPIDAINWKQALDQIALWAARRESRVVCLCNAHSVVTASQDPEFAKVIEAADLATADGMPVAWLIRRSGHREQQRISGPDLMWEYCRAADARHESIFLFGNTEATLQSLRDRLVAEFPRLRIAGMISPPFRAPTAEEDTDTIEAINASGAGAVFVSLGCPKQELWMHAHRDRIRATMIGVGAAFDYHAGTLRRAPRWMQVTGLEWLFRFACEPSRLWRRYLVTNTLFIAGALKQLSR